MINSKKTSAGSRDPRVTRAALLETAAEEFARLGFEGARTRSIALAAGVNQALIRYHFGGKGGLYRAVIADAVGEVRDSMVAIRVSTAPARERLIRFIETLASIVQRKPHFPAMLLREYLSGGEHLTPQIMRQVGEFFATSRKVVEDGIVSGEFRAVDAHALHLSLVGSLVFFHASRQWRDRAGARGELPAPAPAPEHYVRHLQSLLLDGILSSHSQLTKEKRK
jgi:AcrR family transcriptional regulator